MGDMLKAVAEDIEEYEELCLFFGEEKRSYNNIEHQTALRERKEKHNTQALLQFKKKFGRRAGVGSVGLGYQVTHIIIYAKGEEARKRLESLVPKEFNRLPVAVIASAAYR